MRGACTVPLLVVLTGSLIAQIPGWAMGIAIGLQFVGMVLWPPERPLRQDYNLFLRQRTGLLTAVGTAVVPPPVPLTRDRLFAFARLLAAESLVSAYRRLHQGYCLKLHPVSPVVFNWLGPWVRPKDSTLTLTTDGAIEARLGPDDARNLDRLQLRPAGGGTPDSPDAANDQVRAAVGEALAAFLRGEPAEALRRLEHQPLGEIFAVDPARSAVVRLRRLAWVGGILLAGWMVYTAVRPSPRSARPAVALSLEQARLDVGNVGSHTPATSRRRWEVLDSALRWGVVLPPPDWASAAAREYVRTRCLGPRIAGLATVDERLGLFPTAGYEPIRETHLVLAILERVGAVGTIDRRACVDGLLRFHEGRDLFLVPQPSRQAFTLRRKADDPRPVPVVFGDARATFAARESLRILGELDRVTDLAEWEFRPQSRAMDLATDDGGRRRIPSWDEIEAVLLRERFGGGRSREGHGRNRCPETAATRTAVLPNRSASPRDARRNRPPHAAPAYHPLRLGRGAVRRSAVLQNRSASRRDARRNRPPTPHPRTTRCASGEARSGGARFSRTAARPAATRVGIDPPRPTLVPPAAPRERRGPAERVSPEPQRVPPRRAWESTPTPHPRTTRCASGEARSGPVASG